MWGHKALGGMEGGDGLGLNLSLLLPGCVTSSNLLLKDPSPS